MQKIVNLSDECVPQTKLYLYHFDTIELSSGNGPHFQPLSMSLTEKWKMVLVLFCFILFCGVCFVSVLETLETRLEKASGKRAFSDKDEGYYSTISENYVPKSMIYIWTERVGKKNWQEFRQQTNQCTCTISSRSWEPLEMAREIFEKSVSSI